MATCFCISPIMQKNTLLPFPTTKLVQSANLSKSALILLQDHRFIFLTNFIVHWSHASVLHANNPSVKIITLLSKVPQPQLHCTVIWSCGSLSLWYLVQISYAKISVCFAQMLALKTYFVRNLYGGKEIDTLLKGRSFLLTELSLDLADPYFFLDIA